MPDGLGCLGAARCTLHAERSKSNGKRRTLNDCIATRGKSAKSRKLNLPVPRNLPLNLASRNSHNCRKGIKKASDPSQRGRNEGSVFALQPLGKTQAVGVTEHRADDLCAYRQTIRA